MSEDKAKSKPATELKSTNGQAVTFPVKLELERLDGERVQITFQCKFKGKRAWSKERREYLDALRAIDAAADAVDESAETRPPQRRRPLDELVAEGIERDAEMVAKVVNGWSLPEECNADSLADLDDNFGGALRKFLDKYERAIYQGLLGN